MSIALGYSFELTFTPVLILLQLSWLKAKRTEKDDKELKKAAEILDFAVAIQERCVLSKTCDALAFDIPDS